MGVFCSKCGRTVSGLYDTCRQDVCPMALPSSGTNERELTWSKHSSLADAREREALKQTATAGHRIPFTARLWKIPFQSCPKCESTSVKGQFAGERGEVKFTCDECGETWFDWAEKSND